MAELSEQFEKDYLDTVNANSFSKNFDPLGSELFNRLFISPEEVAMDELAKKTGYSLSAVSTKLKQMEEMRMVQKIKKPGTKKLYYYTNKNIGKLVIAKLKTYIERELKPLRRVLPNFLEKYSTDLKKSKDEKFKKQYEIVRCYLEQLRYQERSMLNTIEEIRMNIKEYEKKVVKNNK